MIRKIIQYLLLFLITISLVNCAKNVNEETLVKYHAKSFTKSFDSTNAKSENYVHVKINYVEFTEAKFAPVKDSLNKKVMTYVNTPVFEMKTKNLEELSTGLIADYKKLKKDFPESPAVYELERNVEVINNNEKLLSLKFSEYSFLGGAHPNSVMLYCNIDLKTGRTINLDDLFSGKYMDELNKIAEKYFRKERELKPDENLEEVGFWFKENKFSVNENFAVGKTSLSFFFNDYEITSHAAGPTLIEIPFAELASIIKSPGFIFIK